MVHKPKTSTSYDTLPCEHSNYLATDDNQKDLSLLGQEKHSFFLRLLQRDNSMRGTSMRRLAVGVVPFVWESSPGLPKSDYLHVEDYNSFLMPPLTPPPMMQSQGELCASSYQSLGKLNKINGWFITKISTAIHHSNHRRKGASSRSLLLIDSSVPRHDVTRDDGSPRSNLDMSGHVSSSSSESPWKPSPDESQYRGAGSQPGASNLRENLQGAQSRRLQLTTSAVPALSRISPKQKGCSCFRAPECDD